MWRKPDIEDFYATLEQSEADLFSRSDGSALDTIQRQIDLAVSHARGFIRSGRKCAMSADESLLPEMLVAPAMDFAVFNLLKRLRRDVNASRTKAYDRACALFEKIGAGAIVPEDYGEAPDKLEKAASLAHPAITAKIRLLGRHMEEGI